VVGARTDARSHGEQLGRLAEQLGQLVLVLNAAHWWPDVARVIRLMIGGDEGDEDKLA
jgi:hypothetical protein